jgi:hypothetical protein
MKALLGWKGADHEGEVHLDEGKTAEFQSLTGATHGLRRL